MGVYIKGMEMPKSCWDCFACYDGWCIINQKIEGHRTVTHSCPLIEVPPHGRLIDADCCNDYFYEHMSDDMMIAAMNAINEMPTIIESENE